MESTYNHKAVEAAAQQHWTDTDAYRVVENDPRFPKGKYYACSMLPYPSGKLHMGHVRNYTINDVMLRYRRMNGYNVLMPMGWDAFGLPAENAAIDRKVAPAKWTYANIADMKSQMQPLGLAFDWSREIAACDPDYYKWNQWFFLKLLEKGLAYRKTQIVNWDPVDQTVLANEQVVDGRGWRTGALVEKREIPGYYLAITQYAEELLSAVANPEDANYLKGWPERVRLMQENWIGKSEGVRFAFPHDITDSSGQRIQDGRMYVFTTRADTIMGVTFVAVAPEHPLAIRAGELNPALAAKIEALKQGGTTEAELAAKEKEGVATGLFVTHPLTGDKVEIWVGNYVLITYGDGAVMGVPAHDERDFAFAKKYGLAIKQVITNGIEVQRKAGKDYLGVDYLHYDFDPKLPWKEWYGDKNDALTINSGKYDGLFPKEAVNAIAADLVGKELGEKKTTYRLRDWGISRQRYWGTPIPIIHCDDCGAQPVPYEDLPVVLPEDCIPDGSGNPLNKHAGFHAGVTCPKCSKPARRETDTMDTFVDSSWYYMRYTCPDSKDAMVDPRNDYWMPMDQYIGGIEHAVLHLLYARFWTKAMRDLGLVKFSEPFTNLFTQGMLSADSFYREEASGKKQWFYPHEVSIQHDEKGKPVGATLVADGQPVTLGGIEKMSKSKNNVVEPKDIIERFGADTARAYVMFAGPPDQSAAWSDTGAEGVYRFLRRVWNFAAKQGDAIKSGGALNAATLNDAQKALRREVHLNLKQAEFDYERLQYNTVVSAAMKMLNAIEAAPADGSAGWNATLRDSFSVFLRSLYPLAPHIGQQLWVELGYASEVGELINTAWPQVDPAALQSDTVELVLQVNGKTRGSLTVPSSADKTAIEAVAVKTPEFEKFSEGRAPKKVIVVPGRLVNVVV